MHHSICICGGMVIAAVAFLIGLNLGGAVVWLVLNPMPHAGLKDKSWREARH
jgi:hypothetical protein